MMLDHLQLPNGIAKPKTVEVPLEIVTVCARAAQKLMVMKQTNSPLGWRNEFDELLAARDALRKLAGWDF